MRTYVIFGATSAIALAVARTLVARGDRVLLAARNADRLEPVAQDLRVRGAADRVDTFLIDARDSSALPALVEAARAFAAAGAAAVAGAPAGVPAAGVIDGVLVAHGTLPDQTECAASLDATREAIEVNGTSACLVLAAFAPVLQAQARGVLAVIGSVAGDRGRQSNYTYGAAKAMVATFAEGLDHRMAGTGVRVLCIKPGFVDTPMTAAFDKKGPLWATPAAIALPIVTAMDKSSGVVYTPWFWRLIMLIIRHVPRFIFVRTKL